MKNTAGDAKRRGRKVPKSVQQQYKWIKKQKKGDRSLPKIS